MKPIRYERFGGPEVLQYLDLPDPTPGRGQLLIEAAAIGVNFPDIRERLGVYNNAETRVGGVQLPQIVGGLAVQIARALGAGTVIGTASTPERREFVKGIGADAAISYADPGWTEQSRELTGGRGVDVLIESIGGEVFEQNFDALATFGRYLLLGSSRGPGEPFASRRLMTKSQALIGFHLPVFYDRPELIGNALRFLADDLKTGRITSRVDEVLPLSQAAEAHRRLENREVSGVIVLDSTIES